MQKYDFTAPASGASQTVNAPGHYVKYVAGNAGGNDTGLIITPGSKPGSKILLYPGQSFTLPDSVAQPNGWTFANATGQANIAGTLVIGEGRIDDNTLTGVVQVVDGGKARSMANMAYSAYAGPAVTASQFARLQLWNPATNPNRLIVEDITLWATTAANVALYGSTTQLANAQEPGIPKKLGGTNSVAALYADSIAAYAAPAVNVSYPIVAGQLQVVKIYEPIIVPPGYGLTAIANVPSNVIQMNVEWYEEPNV